MEMWVGTRSAWHNKSLERRCPKAVPVGATDTRCALIRTDGRLILLKVDYYDLL